MLPFVSILTPTANRRRFIPQLLRNYRRQDYPAHRMELVVLDDGDDKVEDLLQGQPGVRYLRREDRLALGHKRNLLTEAALGDILVHMDDDDYYPPRRVSDAVARLSRSEALIAGSSLMYVYDCLRNKVFQMGPFGPNHATNGTFAYKRAYLAENRFDDAAIIRDEALFTRDFSQPMVQLDARSAILCIAHAQNTYTKHLVHEAPFKLKELVKCPESLRFYRYIAGKT